MMKMMQGCFLCLLFAALVGSGCGRPVPAAAVSTNAPAAGTSVPMPTQAQPKLATTKLWLGAEEMVAEMAVHPQEIRTGMMFRTNMAENESMVFDLYAPQQASFWMTNCPMPLSVAYIDSDGIIQEIHPLQANESRPVVSASLNVRFALETRQGWFERHHIGPGTSVRTESGTLMETLAKER